MLLEKLLNRSEKRFNTIVDEDIVRITQTFINNTFTCTFISTYMLLSVGIRYLQCQNVHCYAVFKTHESMFEVICRMVID